METKCKERIIIACVAKLLRIWRTHQVFNSSCSSFHRALAFGRVILMSEFWKGKERMIKTQINNSMPLAMATVLLVQNLLLLVPQYFTVNVYFYVGLLVINIISFLLTSLIYFIIKLVEIAFPYTMKKFNFNLFFILNAAVFLWN